MTRVRFPAVAVKGFFSSSSPPAYRRWDLLSLFFSGYRGAIFPGINLPGREADHSLPSTAVVKYAWKIPSVPPVSSCPGA